MATPRSLSPSAPSFVPSYSREDPSLPPHSAPPGSSTAHANLLPYGVSRLRSGTVNLPTHSRSDTVISSSTAKSRHSMSHTAPPLPFSSPTGMTNFQSSGGSSSTHAGGILPSASFFRPSRPNYYQPPPSLPRQSSDFSTSSQEPDQFPLAPLAEHNDPQLELPDEDRHRQFEASKRYKHSREPLLPIGGPGLSSKKSGNLSLPGSQHPSIARDASERSIGGSSSNTGRGRVRDSMVKMEQLLRQGLNLDAMRKSSTTPLPQSHSRSPDADVRMTFEIKTAESDGGFLSTTPMSRRRKSVSPGSRSPTVSRIRSPDFIPIPPPDMEIPLSAVPMTDPNSGALMRNYQLHPSRNKFFFRGQLLTGGDSPWAFIGSLALVFGIAGVWFGTTCVWWWRYKSPAVAVIGAYMCLLTISCMLTTAFRDPGILPRNLDPDPPYPATSPSDGGTKAPLPRDLRVRAGVVRVKYCPTCKIYRPPRSSHCKMCDNCVDGCDHHCQWVNNCVGRRNYSFFFVFLTSGVATLCLVICTTALHLYFLTREDHINFLHALGRGAGSAVAFALSIMVIWPVTALLVYHMRLLFLNVTTIEQIRNQAHKSLVPGPAPPNPFSHGNWTRNVKAVMCRPAGYSWMDGPGIATEDKRRVNPGMGEKGKDGL